MRRQPPMWEEEALRESCRALLAAFPPAPLSK